MLQYAAAVAMGGECKATFKAMTLPLTDVSCGDDGPGTCKDCCAVLKGWT